jgi:hypothetical protein
MKRILSACLLETIHFKLKDGLEPEEAAKFVREELAHFKAHMNHTRTRYVVEEEQPQPDGSILVRVKKQYNRYDTGKYLES